MFGVKSNSFITIIEKIQFLKIGFVQIQCWSLTDVPR